MRTFLILPLRKPLKTSRNKIVEVRRFSPSDRQRKQVELLVSAGDQPASIAKTLGLEEQVLRRHFSEELKHGAARMRLENLESLRAAARNGSAPAARKLNDVMRRAMQAATPKPHKKRRKPKLSKHEKQRL